MICKDCEHFTGELISILTKNDDIIETGIVIFKCIEYQKILEYNKELYKTKDGITLKTEVIGFGKLFDCEGEYSELISQIKIEEIKTPDWCPLTKKKK
jgi:hypothetical protein